MKTLRGRVLGGLSVSAIGFAVVVLSTLVTEPMDHLSQSCPNGMMPNPAGYYGCVPKRSGGNAVGGNPVGTPTQEMITVCGGNYYTCIWPYGPVV